MDVEDVRAIPATLVSIRSADVHCNDGTLRDLDARDFGVDRGTPKMPVSGGSQRSASSIVCGTRLRSARTSSRLGGWESNPKRRFDVDR